MSVESVPGPARGHLESERFRQVFRRQATTVAVVTLAGPVGFTATSVVSLSATPPLLSFNVAHRSSHYPVFRSSTHAAVHLLRSDQRRLATIFATAGLDRFALVDGWTRGVYGLPILPDVLAWTAVRIRNRLDTGDHSLVVGEVVQAEYGDGLPLIYHDGRYADLDRSSRNGHA